MRGFGEEDDKGSLTKLLTGEHYALMHYSFYMPVRKYSVPRVFLHFLEIGARNALAICIKPHKKCSLGAYKLGVDVLYSYGGSEDVEDRGIETYEWLLEEIKNTFNPKEILQAASLG